MEFWPYFLSRLGFGIIETLKILAITIPVSIGWGIILGSARVYGGRLVNWLATALVVTFRGFPLVVTLFLLFFGLPELGIKLSPYWTAVTAFILCSGAYQSEYVRGAIRSIEMGQLEAARALGMTKWQELFYVVLPQAIPRALPGITNEIIYQIKYSSLAYLVGVEEIFGVTKSVNSIFFRPLESFMTAAAIYLVMTTAAHVGFKSLEKYLSIPGMEVEIR